jgi:hypothetical protein
MLGKINETGGNVLLLPIGLDTLSTNTPSIITIVLK